MQYEKFLLLHKCVMDFLTFIYVFIGVFLFMLCVAFSRVDRMSGLSIMILGVILFFMDFVFGLQYGQIIAFFKIVLCAIFLLYKNANKLLSLLMFFILYGTMVVIDYALENTIFWISGLTLPVLLENHLIAYLLLYVVSVIVAFCTVRYFLIHKIHIEKFVNRANKKILLAIMFQLVIYVLIIVLNIVYSNKVNYPPQIMRINGMLFTVYFIGSCVLLYFFYRMTVKEERLRAKIEAQESLRNYTGHLEQLNEETGRFRHDYYNVMLTMRSYIEERKIEELQEYYEKVMAPFYKKMKMTQQQIGHLKNMRIPEIKGVLSGKCMQATNDKLNFSLFILQKIERMDMDILDICKLIGILLDNAMEAAAETEMKNVEVHLLGYNDCVEVLVRNDALPEPLCISELCKKGVTTKEGHEGIGLYEVNEIVRRYENVEWFMKCKDSVFEVKLVIYHRG